MANYGAKVSRAGYDVKTAADHQLLWSSSFPTLTVAFTGVLASGANFQHGLGYEPVFLAQGYGSLSGGFGSIDYTDQQPRVSVDTDKIYNEMPDTIRYYIFFRAIRTSYTAPVVNTTAISQSAVSQDYGFKVSTEGVNVKTATLANLVSFSGLSLAGQAVRQVLVHQQGYEDNIGTTSTKTYNHSLGYKGLFFAYRRIHGQSKYYIVYTRSDIQIPPGSITFVYRTSMSSSSLTLTKSSDTDTTDFAYIIFKDQF